MLLHWDQLGTSVTQALCHSEGFCAHRTQSAHTDACTWGEEGVLLTWAETHVLSNHIRTHMLLGELQSRSQYAPAKLLPNGSKESCFCPLGADKTLGGGRRVAVSGLPFLHIAHSGTCLWLHTFLIKDTHLIYFSNYLTLILNCKANENLYPVPDQITGSASWIQSMCNQLLGLSQK